MMTKIQDFFKWVFTIIIALPFLAFSLALIAMALKAMVYVFIFFWNVF